MFYCDICKTYLSIVNESEIGKETQTRGQDEKKNDALIKKLINNEKIMSDELIGVDVDEIMNSDKIKGLDKTVKKNIEKILNQNETDSKNSMTNQFYFKCSFCGAVKKIKPLTRVYSKSLGGDSTDCLKTDYSYMFNNNVLPHTSNNKCTNKECPTNTDDVTADFVIFRQNKGENSYKTFCQCTICKTVIPISDMIS